MHTRRGASLLATSVVLIALVLLGSGPLLADSVIYANDDCFTFQASSTSVFDDQGITCKSQSGNQRFGWIEFTLGTEAVQQALLNMFQTGDWGQNYSTTFRASEYNLDETALTYSTQPAVSGWTQIPGWSAAAGARQYYAADITAFYNANLGKTVTFRLACGTSGTNYGGTYEDREGSKLAAGAYTAPQANVPYIQTYSSGDTEPPTQPGDIAYSACCSAVRIMWSASTDNIGVSGYRVYRDGSALGTTGGLYYNQTTNLVPGTTYQYSVTAYDAAGNESTAATITVPVPLCYDGNEIVFDFDDRENGTVYTYYSDPNTFFTAAEGVAGVNHWFGKRVMGNDGGFYWAAPNGVNNYRYEFAVADGDGSLTIQTATPADQSGALNAVAFINTNNFGNWFRWTRDGDYVRGVSVEADINIVGDMNGWCAPWDTLPAVDPCSFPIDMGHQGSDWGTQWGDRALLYFSVARNMDLTEPGHAAGSGSTGDGAAYWFALNPGDIRNPDDDRIRIFSDSNYDHATFRLNDGLGFGLVPEDGTASGSKDGGGNPYPRDGAIQGNGSHLVLKIAACNAGGNSEYWDIWLTRPDGTVIHIDPATAERVSGGNEGPFGWLGHTMMTTYENKDGTGNTLRLGNNTANMIWGTRYNSVKVRNDWDGDVSVKIGSLGQLRGLSPGAAVIYDGSGGDILVTTRTTTPTNMAPFSLYLEQEDRSAAVRLDTNDESIPTDNRGKRVASLAGVLMVDADGNPYLDVPPGQLQLVDSTKTVKPVGMTNKSMCGTFAPGGSGLPNTGMLATIWGRVVSASSDSNFNGVYVIDDGSGTLVSVRDYWFDGTLAVMPQPDDYWMFTGAVALMSDDSGGYTKSLVIEGDSGVKLQ